MPAKCFIDTNVIIYALGPASTKTALAAQLFTGFPSISTQILSETINVLSRRFHLEMTEIRKLVMSLQSICRVEMISTSIIQSGLDLKDRYGFSWYDSLVLATALDSGCKILYSEDFQDNQKIENKLRIVNPFKTA